MSLTQRLAKKTVFVQALDRRIAMLYQKFVVVTVYNNSLIIQGVQKGFKAFLFVVIHIRIFNPC